MEEVEAAEGEKPSPRRASGRASVPGARRKGWTPIKIGVVGCGLFGLLLLIAVPLTLLFLFKPGNPTGAAFGGPISITAAQLIKEYRDSLDAYVDKEYKDKPVTFTGRAEDISTGYAASVVLSVKMGSERIGRISCSFGDEKKPQLIPLKKGQEVTVRGTYKAHALDGTLLLFEDCELVSSAGSQGANTAENMLKSCLERVDAVDKKYKGHALKVQGVVKTVDPGAYEGAFPLVELQSSTDSWDVVYCSFSLKAKTDIRQLQEGDEINLKGVCQGVDTVGVSLKDCELVNLPERLRGGR